MTRRKRLIVGFGIGATCVLAACSTTTAGQGVPNASAPPASPSAPSPTSAAPPSGDTDGLARFYNQKMTWGSCDSYAAIDGHLDPDLQCGKIMVPVDYAKPNGDTAEIAVSRLPASGNKIGSLLMNPGGPGGSGLSMASVGKNTELAERFDIVGFDPRGVGASTPQIRCVTPKEADQRRKDNDVDMSPAGIAQTESEDKDYVAKCAQRTGDEFLEHVGTREVVRDMDVMRAVLGDDKLNYVGYSYGTRLGGEYAETFPTKVRAMVLDGAVDPDQDPLTDIRLQAQGFQKVFEAYVSDCVKHRNCPLGTDPSDAVKQFRDLVNPLIDHPAQTTDPRGLSYQDAMTGVQQALYSPDLWSMLTDGLNELKQGRGDTLLQLADAYDGRNDDGTYSNLNDAFNAIRCVDDPRIMDRSVMGKLDVEVRKIAPFEDDGRGTGQAPLDMCAFWPVPNTSTPHKYSAPGLPTTVVISTTNDPATPYQAGVDLAQQLHASLITYHGDQHTVALTSGVKCVDDAVINYLINLTPPPAGLTC
ncbi:alpha/beta hydrolase [Skermania sp. ID1734]|uniref:alpha/beta hydrolase n=1 Tax=Skermania sp. ID1734 TaxID=2597516 RepID=UPI00117D8551|nr:alpha/beta hydrolase [Skermania sp. ID1734]TSE01102.1 alpha/beta hydrolase [Skermania sp. ID1734]